MSEVFKDCKPTIMGRDTLMDKEGNFHDMDGIKSKCDCINKQTCCTIAFLLSKDRWEEAEKKIDLLIDE